MIFRVKCPKSGCHVWPTSSSIATNQKGRLNPNCRDVQNMYCQTFIDEGKYQLQSNLTNSIHSFERWNQPQVIQHSAQFNMVVRSNACENILMRDPPKNNNNNNKQTKGADSAWQGRGIQQAWMTYTELSPGMRVNPPTVHPEIILLACRLKVTVSLGWQALLVPLVCWCYTSDLGLILFQSVTSLGVKRVPPWNLV